jgi:hypothetical protein
MRRAFVLALAVSATAATRAHADQWEFAASAFVYVPPDIDTFVSPNVEADRGALHLEARYNYEDLKSASAFIGRTFDFVDEDVHGSLVPMFGLVFGNTAGMAPGLNIDLTWQRFAFSTESELVIDLPDSQESFLYSWIEATLEPARGVRLGVAGQRTKTSETGLEIRRGPMLALAHKRAWLAFYWFNPDRSDEETLVYAAGFSF